MRRVLIGISVVLLVLTATVAIGQVTQPDGSFTPTRVDVFTLDGARTLEGEQEFLSIVNTGVDATTWAGYLLHAQGRMTVTFSGNFTGDPFELRITDGNDVLYPASTTFAPDNDSGSFSYTFAAKGSRKADCHYIDPEWRSTNPGGSTTITEMVVTITYRRDTTRGDQPIACPA